MRQSSAAPPWCGSSSCRRSGGGMDGDIFDVHILGDSFVTALTTEAGRLHAPEWRCRIGHHALIEAHHAHLDGLGDAQGTVDITTSDSDKLPTVTGRRLSSRLHARAPGHAPDDVEFAACPSETPYWRRSYGPRDRRRARFGATAPERPGDRRPSRPAPPHDPRSPEH